LDEAIFAAREDRLKPKPDNNARRSKDGSGEEKTSLICTHWKQEDGNETASTHVCISNARLRSDFNSDKIDASNAAVRCRRSRLEMQQVGVDSNHLRAQSRCPLYLDELKSLGRAGMSVSCRYCCESRKSNCSENLAKVDF